MRTALRLFVLAVTALHAAAADRPNVLLVITDDQGYGDLGAHGNPVVRTPNLDAFAKESVWLKNFYVSPVCSPTRSSLLTGLYNYRTGVVDTFVGRSLMRPDVRTLQEYLGEAGYRTGLFGKWHLGDNYPLRPEDRGFQTTLWSRGGGLAQPSDPPEVDPKTAYFDPVLVRNGKEVRTTGYCTDVFTDAAVEFIAADAKKPFFAYVAYNAPHGPYQVHDRYVEPYRKRDLGADAFPKLGRPWATPKLNAEEIARAYGMIENIDANFARLLKALTDAGAADNTVVVFLTDNGPGGVRFNAGLRNRKGTVYEGGIRVPCYVRWPAELTAGTVVSARAAHIDLTPTLVHACTGGVPNLDGRSLLPLLRRPNAAWPSRPLFFQWHRGDVPEKFRAFAVHRGGLKLVQANGAGEGAKWQPKFELFDVDNDPFETTDLSAEKPAELAALKDGHAGWFDDVTGKGFAPPRVVLGSDKENPSRLSRQDWRGPKAGWSPDSNGHWEVTFERAGRYEFRLISRADFQDYELFFNGHSQGGKGGAADMRVATVEAVVVAGNDTISATVGTGGKDRGVDYIEVKHLGK